ncbi:hypothetical protein OpiT1DRAFT_00045 [Opitutaceae bacterium TAV1]|nr:hypothetical protein OpiT1DRAFT_00045 [Opitutaceae bacterium TAV1]
MGGHHTDPKNCAGRSPGTANKASLLPGLAARPGKKKYPESLPSPGQGTVAGQSSMTRVAGCVFCRRVKNIQHRTQEIFGFIAVRRLFKIYGHEVVADGSLLVRRFLVLLHGIGFVLAATRRSGDTLHSRTGASIATGGWQIRRYAEQIR